MAHGNKRLKKDQGPNRVNCASPMNKLDKDLFAPGLGAVILLAIILIHLAGMIWNKQVPDILSNAFLIVLGYFFGKAE